jgi:hypothetical protein
MPTRTAVCNSPILRSCLQFSMSRRKSTGRLAARCDGFPLSRADVARGKVRKYKQAWGSIIVRVQAASGWRSALSRAVVGCHSVAGA